MIVQTYINDFPHSNDDAFPVVTISSVLCLNKLHSLLTGNFKLLFSFLYIWLAQSFYKILLLNYINITQLFFKQIENC